MIDATALVKAAQGLDPLPATVARLASLVVRPDWSLNEAAHLVEFDAALTGRLLRLANSAAMAGLSRVNTARDAIMRVGIGPALAFAAASGLRRELKRALPEYGLTDGQLWRTRWQARSPSSPSRGGRTPAAQCFTAAIHDIGKIVLARFLKPDHSLAGRRRNSAACPACRPNQVLGVNHATLGGADRGTVEAARTAQERGTFYHRRTKATTSCATWSISQRRRERIGEGSCVDRGVVAGDSSLARLGLTESAWEDLLLTLPAAFEATLRAVHEGLVVARARA